MMLRNDMWDPQMKAVSIDGEVGEDLTELMKSHITRGIAPVIKLANTLVRGRYHHDVAKQLDTMRDTELRGDRGDGSDRLLN
jgi:hypothetical protein